MIVQSSSIGMDSARTYTSVSRDAVKTEKSGNVLTFLGTLSNAGVKPADEAKAVEKEAEDTKDAQNELQNEYDEIFNKMRAAGSQIHVSDKTERDIMQKIRAQCIQFLINLLFGKTTSIDDESIEEELSDDEQGLNTSGGLVVNFGVRSQSYYHYYAESEETSFSTTGKVVCADGREIDFDLELTMSRSFTEYYEENFVSIDTQFVDPLIINLDSSVASVFDVKVKFDLDADGTKEEIGVLGPQSGYLSFDKNGDGIIGDGSELFGTASGNGFEDLAVYDEDGNGFIDEADDIFDRLSICFINEDGTQELYSLKDKGIGAICLASKATEFSLNDLATNEARARITRTGIFLYENGNIGTVQNLDLAQ